MSAVPNNSAPSPQDVAKALVDAAEKLTVAVQLKPVTFQISVHYLGADRIKQQANVYTCKFELLKESSPPARQVPPPNDNVPPAARANPGTTVVAAAEVIGNTLREIEKTAAGKMNPLAVAGIPSSDGGTNADPAADDVYRVQILDNHAMSLADVNRGGSSNTGLLGTLGDTVSRPANYAANSWALDVQPAVPFRVIVRKFVGDAQVDLDPDDKLELQFQIKDPIEEYDQNDGRRWQFFRSMYRTFNRSEKNPNPGDDNALKRFKGVRTPSATKPGVLPSEVIKIAPVKSPPVEAEAAGTPGSVNFGDLSKASDHWQGGMRCPVNIIDGVADGTGVKRKVGVFDYAFCPPPVGGDNYRFLFSLLGNVDRKQGGAKKDVRAQNANGAPVKVVDDQKREVKPGVCYTTGRFVIWRKTEFTLAVLCNNATINGVTWATVTDIYRKVFVEVTAPVHSCTVAIADWLTVLRAKYGNRAEFNNNAQMQTDFARQMVPQSLIDDGTYQDTLAQDDPGDLTRAMIKHMCDKRPSAIVGATVAAPQDNAAQAISTERNGLFVLLCREFDPSGSTMGAYCGDRIFYMHEVGNTPSTTSTTAHELGHALWLRHSHTERTRTIYVDSANTPSVIQQTNGGDNGVFIDHDHHDAYACLMSYTRPITAEPCAACALNLRGYDCVDLRKTNFYKKWQKDHLGSWTITHARMENWTLGGVNVNLLTLRETIACANGATINLRALGRATNFVDRGGNNNVGRANVSIGQLPADVTWSVATVSGGGAGTITQDPGTTSARFVATHTGVVRVTFKRFDITATANITIT